MHPAAERSASLTSPRMTTDDTPPRRPLAGGIGYVYAKLADDLQARVRAGEFPPGTRLPGRPRLAAEYGVGEMTVRRALRELAARGIVAAPDSLGALVISPGHNEGT